MSAPLWRVFVGPNGACYCGNDDGTAKGSNEYGTEGVVCRNAAIWKAQGKYIRIEHRESPGEPWKVLEEQAEAIAKDVKLNRQQTLF